jgi:DNA-binding transcriptional MerR regulator
MCKVLPATDTAEPVFFLIGELAEKTGLNPSAIRFYEREGLVKPRRHGRLRVYSATDAVSLSRIAQLRALGLPVKIINRLLKTLPETSRWLESDVVKEALLAHSHELVRHQAEIAKRLEALSATLVEKSA